MPHKSIPTLYTTGTSRHTNTHTHRLFSHYHRSWGHCLQLPFHKCTRWQATVLVNVKAGYTPELHMVEQTSSRRQWKSLFIYKFSWNDRYLCTNINAFWHRRKWRAPFSLWILCYLSPPLFSHELPLMWPWSMGTRSCQNKLHTTPGVTDLDGCMLKMYLRRVRSGNFCSYSVCGKFCWYVVKPEHHTGGEKNSTYLHISENFTLCALS